MIVVIGDSAGGQLSNLKKSAGGHVLAHATTIRFMFRKANETKISARSKGRNTTKVTTWDQLGRSLTWIRQRIECQSHRLIVEDPVTICALLGVHYSDQLGSSVHFCWF
ncbi:uncharacterized protein LOC113314067 [Papaver somniferum]|uniref:uncharacterized protein LOC113314067 n=1 Tax=Papaver somniferum TaxID=3469 RepID=UPI000E6FC988|nr:uncharacterized protein LOC113314067 [Papaver somniferum]XP_026418629.1 uncharacterized protein LOC113314067 [Papaver somniferum]XP_026418630.1 uncharacterized protein LOC113314067 [Papaver somniferum]XP_026418631.1 uncharacterized protein LOC113314067 [Papaver somniferum]